VLRKDKLITYPCPTCDSTLTISPNWMEHIHEPDFNLTVSCPKCRERQISQKAFQNEIRIPYLNRLDRPVAPKLARSATRCQNRTQPERAQA
jgi:C4-type Zn-finger protein